MFNFTCIDDVRIRWSHTVYNVSYFLLSLLLGITKNMTHALLPILFYSVCVIMITYNTITSTTSAPQSAANMCMLRNSFHPGFVAQGDFVIGGIFPIHSKQEMPYQNSTYRRPPVKCNR